MEDHVSRVGPNILNSLLWWFQVFCKNQDLLHVLAFVLIERDGLMLDYRVLGLAIFVSALEQREAPVITP